MKKVLKIDRPVHPISLAPRKKNPGQPPSPSPQHKIDWQNVVLKPIDTNRSHNSALLSTMRKQLLTVREDVEKIVVEEPMSETKVTVRMELQMLRDEVRERREVEGELRRAVEGERERVQWLEGEVGEERRAREEVQGRLGRVQGELGRVQAEKSGLVGEIERMQATGKQTVKEKEDYGVQYTEDEVFQLRKRIHEVQKERISLSSKLKEKQGELKRVTEDCQVAIREKDIKYNNCLNEFKKLESKIGRSKDQSLGQLKTKIEEMEKAFQGLSQASDKLRQQNNDLVFRLDKGRQQIQEQKRYNEDLSTKVKTLQNEIINNNQNNRQLMNTLNKQLGQARLQCQSFRQKYQSKCRQPHPQKPTTNTPSPNEQLHRAKLQILSLQINLNKLTTQLQRSRTQLQSTIELSSKKDIYIEELEKRGGNDNGGLLEDLEKKCRELCDQQIKIVEEYEGKVQKLEGELERSRREMVEKGEVMDSSRSFDEAIKKQITMNEELKEVIRQKHEEIIKLRTQNQQWKRKAQSLKSQTQIDRLKGMTQQKSLKCHFQITIDNLRNEIQSQKRKYQTLQRKAQFRGDDLKKKDQFIQHVIIGKIAKPENEQEGEYIKKELVKFFSVNYEFKLLAAEQRIKQLEKQLWQEQQRK